MAVTLAEKIKGYYEKGYYTAVHILAFLKAGVLTEAEYGMIIGG